MLGGDQFVGFIPVTDIDAARTFYCDILGLSVVESSPFALVLDAGGTPIRITPVGSFTPQPFTVAGWDVADIERAVGTMTTRGVEFCRYDQMEQSAEGIWTTPSGDKVAWFLDPDRNTLSLTQFAPEA